MNNTDLLINNSILYRTTQKFFDQQLEEYGIGYGQVIFLMLINESEGTTMKDLTQKGSFDKGTTTKGINKLVKQGYVRLEVDPNDKRSKLLYTTKEAEDLIAKMYLIRKEWWGHLTHNLSVDDMDAFSDHMQVIVNNALQYSEVNFKAVHFYGLQKLTLLDYPEKMACTLFTGGCNFKCPYCHNKDLVFLPEKIMDISEDDIFSFLDKRKNLLDGICLSGGEPLLQEGLSHYLRKMKELGYAIKIDTNGSFPMRLKSLVDEGLVDYVAMDIKNDPNYYGETIGLDNFIIDSIEETKNYLLENHVDYEFRTTLVKEYHNKERIESLAKWIQGAKRFYIQNFKDSDRVIMEGLHGFEYKELEEFKDICLKYIDNVDIRGGE